MKKKIQYLTVEEMNQKLEMVKKYYILIKGPKKGEFGLNAFLEDKRIETVLSIKEGSKSYEYHCRKDTIEFNKNMTGAEAFKIVSQYFKIPEAKCEYSAKPFLYYNKKYNKTRQQAYGYDLNSAYSWAMLQPIPDTTKIVGKNRIVKNGELGFKSIINETIDNFVEDLVLVLPGKNADIIFAEMPSPFERFVKTWYNRKKNAKNKADKIKAKGVLNYSIGYFQRKNPYIRATIISRCNNLIKSLVNESTLFCNTDSLVSYTRRFDIEQNLGLEVGQWKLEHEGMFAYVGFNYQWNKDIPTYRGVPKSWFPENYDILSDGIPKFGNVYYLNDETLQLEEIKNG